jgi:rhamnogalacturonyl hydrolase YesR
MNILVNRLMLAAGAWLLAFNLTARADAPAASGFSAEIKPAAILDVMQHVADWQLAQPADTNRPNNWVPAAGDVGILALAGISADPKYRQAMMTLGTNSDWQLPAWQGRKYHADDQCIGQTWTELYFTYRNRFMIAPLRERFDYILAHPSEATGLDYRQPKGKAQELWSWCDSLFMAPPTWVRLYAATGDERYLDFAVTNWWRTTDFLYDKDEHLFFRDSTFFKKKEANGEKVFWSRGNGWVFAALPRMLQYLPANHPDRPRFEQLFKDMAQKILACQQPDGLWHASLLDPASFPHKETSGSGFYTYGLAWGVNQGLLDRATYEPAVEKAWTALVGCVDADGKLTHVQPVGSDPKTFADDATAPYGVGAFLLAGSEVYRQAVLSDGKAVAVKVANPANFRRNEEIVELSAGDVAGHGLDASLFAPGKLAVLDGLSAKIIDSQIYASEPGQPADKLIFQTDFAPGEIKTFYLVDAATLAAVPAPVVKTMARFVPERYDDFAWESDVIAHRTYGLALIKAENTISSGPDVWIKKTRGLIVDTMYATKHYHEDNGEFMDDYRVGHSRGCGGVGVWDGQKLYTSSNYHNWRLIVSGPLRSVFEITYDAWDAAGRKVSETKRYSIDAGSWFTKAQSTFASEDPAPLTIAIGLGERACGTNGTELIAQDQTEGWLSYWQPEDKPKGIIGDAIILPKGQVQAFTNDTPDMPDAKIHAEVPQPTHEGAPPIRNLLAITQAQVGQPYTYYFGATWNRSGDFTSHTEWEQYVSRFAERRDAPLQVTVGN